jgi:hypothetical protein
VIFNHLLRDDSVRMLSVAIQMTDAQVVRNIWQYRCRLFIMIRCRCTLIFVNVRCMLCSSSIVSLVGFYLNSSYVCIFTVADFGMPG